MPIFVLWPYTSAYFFLDFPQFLGEMVAVTPYKILAAAEKSSKTYEEILSPLLEGREKEISKHGTSQTGSVSDTKR